MIETWRLLDTPPMTAAENMALDDTLLELKGEGKTPNTIHFLQFSPRSVLVGFHQAVAEEIRQEYCQAEGIETNRRITGGGSIFFDDSQLGWEIICDKAYFNAGFVDQKLFERLSEPIIEAIKKMGLSAVFRPRNDIEINGRKISGTGGTESHDGFLFQGSMLVDFDVDTMLKSLRIPVEKLKAKEIDSVKERVTCLNWELGRTPSLEEIKSNLIYGFEKHFKIKLVPSGLTDKEKSLFKEKLPFYQSKEWIDMVNPRVRKSETIQAAYKSENGMVRFTLVVDQIRKKIKNGYITGDFLSFPTRALYDLESQIRGVNLDYKAVETIIRDFFASGQISIPGMTEDDFLKPLKQVFEKIAISDLGIPLEHCNLISVTNGSFKDVIQKQPSVLLLPYCAKMIECKLRYKKGCALCGKCTVGSAWQMGLQKKMKTVCVTSFEDLLAQIRKMKANGDSAFIGCCCTPFYNKHADDFEREGVPGILLDINDSTCYDLDQAKEAYQGKFSNQTRVNLELLTTVLNA